MTALVVGDLRLALRRSDRRRTMQITVERDGALTMTAPGKAQRQQLERFVRAKRHWIYEKLALKEALPVAAKKEFVSGESFSYLGRSYRLQLVADAADAIRLEAGRFKLRRADAPAGRWALQRWYVEHAEVWIQARVADWSKRLGVEPRSVAVREQGYRWGSCGTGGCLYFHWKVIQLPPRLVDYVIVHELAHLKHPDHGSGFWGTVARAMPDFATRRDQLRLRGATVS